MRQKDRQEEERGFSKEITACGKACVSFVQTLFHNTLNSTIVTLTPHSKSMAFKQVLYSTKYLLIPILLLSAADKCQQSTAVPLF